MSLYFSDEICKGCVNAVWCNECESFKYCSIGTNPNFMTGKCDNKETNNNEE